MTLELPSASVSVLDGGLGLVRTPSEDVHFVLGCSSKGTLLAPFSITTIDRLKSDYGAGPAVKAAAYSLGKTAASIVFVRLAATARAAQIKGLTKPSGTTVTLSGTPNEGYDIVIECTEEGAIGTLGASFKWSKDGGDTYSDPVALAAGTAGTHTGTTDTTTAGLYGGSGDLDGTKFSYTPLPGGSPVTVTLTAPADAAALVSQVNAQLGATIASIVGDRLKLTSAALGATGGFTLAAGSPDDALAVLGMTAATYNGTNGDTTIALTGTGLTANFTAGDEFSVSDEVTAWTIPAAQSIGPVTTTRADTDTPSTSVITLTGTPIDDFEIVVVFDSDFTVGESGGTYRYSLDGGRNFTPKKSLGTADTIALLDGEEASGVTVNLGAGTLDTNDKVEAKAFGPDWAAADAITAIDNVLDNTNLSWRFAHFAGWKAKADIASIAAKLQAVQATKAKFTFGLFSARPRGTFEKESNWEARLLEEFESLADTRTGVGAGQARITCAITGRRDRRSCVTPIVARIVSKTLQVDPGRRLDGPLGPDVELYDENGQRKEHDALKSTVLHGARFLTLRTYDDRPGVFVTRGNLMSAENSDFSRIANRAVMDLATAVFNAVMLEQLENHLAANPAVGGPPGAVPGALREVDARKIDRELVSALSVALVSRGYAANVHARVSRTDPFSSTGTLTAQVKVEPLIYVDKSEGEIAFINPKFAAFQTA